MLNESSRGRVKEHAAKYPNVGIELVITLEAGYVSCLNGVQRMFGPLIMCHPEDAEEVRRLISESPIGNPHD